MHLQCTCNALAFNKSCESMIYGTFFVVVVFKVTKPINHMERAHIYKTLQRYGK